MPSPAVSFFVHGPAAHAGQQNCLFMTDRELLRRLFYARIALGGKVDDYIAEDDPELWRLVYERLTVNEPARPENPLAGHWCQ